MGSASDFGFKADAPVKRPNQAVYDPQTDSVKEATWEQAQELAKEGLVTGTNAYNEQLKNSSLSKAAALASGTANFAGLWNALLGGASKLGVDSATRQLRAEAQVNAEHPGYHAVGELLPVVAPMLRIGRLGKGGLAAAEGIEGLFGIGGNLGTRAAAAVGAEGRVAGALAKGVDAATGALPAFEAKALADTVAASEVGHREQVADERRTAIVKDPITVELLASTAFHAAVDTVVANSVVHGAVGAVRAGVTASKGALGLLEQYGRMKRKLIRVPEEPGAGPRYTSYVRVDHAPVGEARPYPEQGTLIEGQGLTDGPKALPESAGPDGQPSLAAPDDAIDPLDAHAAKARPSPRPEHLQAMAQEHGVISLPGDFPEAGEQAVGIPRAGVEIPEPIKIDELDPKYAGNAKLQLDLDIAKSSLSDAEKKAVAHEAAKAEIPKVSVNATAAEAHAPAKPVPPDFDAASTEPVFEYGADYKKEHKLEALRQMTEERLRLAHPDALEKWEMNKIYTEQLNTLKAAKEAGTPMENHDARWNAVLEKKMANKEELKAMVPRHYDPDAKTYAPSFEDLNSEYRRVVRGDVANKPRVTFGPKSDAEALAQHTENMKVWAKENAAFIKAQAKAESVAVKAQKAAETAQASEAKRVKAAVDKAQAQVKRVEDRIAADERKMAARFEADQARAEKAYNDALARNKAKAAKDAARAQSQAEKKAIREAERHQNEIAALEKKQAERFMREEQAAAKEQAKAQAALEKQRARDAVKEASDAEKAKTLAAKEADKAAKEADKYAKAQKKAQDAAKPRWEEKATRESVDEFGHKVETIHTKHENGQTTTKRTIRIRAPKQPPKFIKGDWEEPFSQSSIYMASGGGTLLGGPHTGGAIGAGMLGINKFVRYGMNSKGLHDTFAGAMRLLEADIGPAAARLYNQSKQRGRRHAPAPSVNLASYQPTTKAVGYASQNPESVTQHIDRQIPEFSKEHPEVAAGIKITTTKAVQALNDAMPKKPYPAAMQNQDYNPPRAMQVSFLRKYKILGSPREALASGDPMAIKLVSQVYPALYAEYCSQLTQFVQSHKRPMYNRQARLISQFIGADVRPIDNPAALQRLQATGGPEQPPPPGQKPIGQSNASTKAAGQRASLDAPEADLSAIGG
jgi:hypothetical protein